MVTPLSPLSAAAASAAANRRCHKNTVIDLLTCRVVLAAIGTFVKGCFRANDVPISKAFSTIQEKFEEAQAVAAALRATRTSGTSSSSSSRNSVHLAAASVSSASAVGSTVGSTNSSGSGVGGGGAPPRPPRRVSSFTAAQARFVLGRGVLFV